MNMSYTFKTNEFDEFTEGDPFLLKQLLEIFIRTSRQDMDRLYKALHQRDDKECIKTAHKLCSTYSYFKLSGLREVMVQIEENMLFKKNFLSAEYLLAQTYPLIKSLDEQIEQFLIKQRN